MTGDQLAALPLLLLAVYRLTLLATADTITQAPRDWLVTRATRQAYHRRLGTDLEWHNPPPLGPRRPGGLPMLEPRNREYTWRSSCECGFLAAAVNGSADEVNAAVDHHVREHVDYQAKLAVLLGCPWCASFWLAIPAAVSWWHFADRAWWLVAAAVLAGSAVAGLLAHLASPE